MPSLIEILQVDVRPFDHNNPTGQVTYRTLSVKANIRHITLQRMEDKRTHFFALGADEVAVGNMEVHFDSESNESTQFHCMPVRILCSDRVEGLLLQSTGEKDMEFIRVAHFHSDDGQLQGQLLKQEQDIGKSLLTII